MTRLQERFIRSSYPRDVVWDKQNVSHCYKLIHSFLEGMLLLVRITSGQPVCGSEITIPWHTDSAFNWNIYIENGLIALVIPDLKGYACIKIIHAYLSKEVSELFVCFLWMLHPFLRGQLIFLFPDQKPGATFFLCSDRKDSRLSNYLNIEAAELCLVTIFFLSTYAFYLQCFRQKQKSAYASPGVGTIQQLVIWGRYCCIVVCSINVYMSLRLYKTSS